MIVAIVAAMAVAVVTVVAAAMVVAVPKTETRVTALRTVQAASIKQVCTCASAKETVQMVWADKMEIFHNLMLHRIPHLHKHKLM